MVKINLGTYAFLAILLVAAISAFIGELYITTLIVAICGAAVALLNITKKEQTNFLISLTALVVIVLAWLIQSGSVQFNTFLTNLVVGFGVAGFIIALGVIIKIGIER